MMRSLKTIFKEFTGAETILLVLTLLLVSIPVFDHLGSISLRRWDESRIAVNAFEMLKSGNLFVVHYLGEPDMWNTKPPLFIWMMSLSMQVFGVNEFAVRFPSAISVIVIVIAGIWFSKKHLGSIYPALLMGLILAVSKGFVGYHVGRSGDFDASLSLAVFISALFYFLFLKSGERKNLIGFLFFLGIGIWIKGIAACLFLPILFLLTLIFKKFKFLFQKSLILPYAVFLLGIFIPYIIREILNPGYLQAVYFNELAGRYLEVNEGHSGPFTFYLKMMLDNKFVPWLYLLLPSAAIAYWRSSDKLRMLIIYLSVLWLGYFLILSFSETKLDWYDAPLYPIMALIVALGLWKSLEMIHNALLPNKRIAGLFIVLIVGALFYEQYTSALNRSNPNNYSEYPELKYRDLIRDAEELYPDNLQFIIPKFDYNSHTDFYSFIRNQTLERIIYIDYNADFNAGDTLLICENIVKEALHNRFELITISERDGRFISVVIGPSFVTKLNYQEIESKIGCTDLERLYSVFINNQYVILNDQDWTNVIREKAESNQVSFKDQLNGDNLYILSEQGKITFDEKLCLERMLLEIK